jgi:hypothetical protein
MQKLLYTLTVASTLSLSNLAEARLERVATKAQVSDDIASFLKIVHQAQLAHFAEKSSYSANLSELGLQTPFYLSDFGSLSLSATQTSFVATFRGSANPALNTVISIQESGRLKGVSQYASAHELKSEIKNLLNGFHTAQMAFFAEYSRFSTNPAEIGIIVPDQLSAYIGQPRISIAADSFTVSFDGVVYPVARRQMSVNHLGVISGLE